MNRRLHYSRVLPPTMTVRVLACSSEAAAVACGRHPHTPDAVHGASPHTISVISWVSSPVLHGRRSSRRRCAPPSVISFPPHSDTPTKARDTLATQCVHFSPASLDVTGLCCPHFTATCGAPAAAHESRHEIIDAGGPWCYSLVAALSRESATRAIDSAVLPLIRRCFARHVGQDCARCAIASGPCVVTVIPLGSLRPVCCHCHPTG